MYFSSVVTITHMYIENGEPLFSVDNEDPDDNTDADSDK